MTWKPLTNLFLNKTFTYIVNLKEIDRNILKSCETNEVKKEFPDLKPFTKYSIQVAARTYAGCGPMSQELFFTTAEAGTVIICINYTCC